VDKFFDNLVNQYGEYSVQSKAFWDVMEVGAQLYTPLCQLVGDEPLHSRVQSINPRLELWLRSMGSNVDFALLPQSIKQEHHDKTATHTVARKKKSGIWRPFTYFKTMMNNDNYRPQPDGDGKTLFPPSPPTDNNPLKVKKIEDRSTMPAKLNNTGKNILNGNVDLMAEDFIEVERPTDLISRSDRSKKPIAKTTNITVGIKNRQKERTQTDVIVGWNDVGNSNSNLEDEVKTHLTPSRAISKDAMFSERKTKFIDGNGNGNGHVEEKQGTKHNTLSTPLYSSLPTASSICVRQTPSSFIVRMLNRATPPGQISRRRMTSEIELSGPTIGTGSGVTGQLMAAYNIAIGDGVGNATDDDEKLCRYAWLLSGRGRWFMAATTEPIWTIFNTQPDSKTGKERDRDESHAHTHSYSHSNTQNRTNQVAMIDYDDDAADGCAPCLPIDSSALSSSRPRAESKDEDRQRAITPSNIPTTHSGPAAFVSMTYPRIICDAASEACTYSPLTMREASTLRIGGSNRNSESEDKKAKAITCLAVNPSESLILIGSRAQSGGIRVASISSEPMTTLSRYQGHEGTPTFATFLANGSKALSCDGLVHIWDIETSSRLQHYPAVSRNFMRSDSDSIKCVTLLDSSRGFSCGVRPSGDDVLIAATQHVVAHLDIRTHRIQTVAEWNLPPTSSLSTSQVTDSDFDVIQGGPVMGAGNAVITSVLCIGYYVLAGTSQGGIWAIDRRTGSSIASSNAHDSTIVKLLTAGGDECTFFCVSEKSAASIWHLSGSNLVRLYNVEGLPQTNTGILSNNVFLHNYEEPGNFSYHHHQDHNLSIRYHNMMYCFAGHKQSIGRLPMINNETNSFRRSISIDYSYFYDRFGVKIHKKDLHITSALLLPLRRIILLGTEDGSVRTIV
jgi:hypothetical protein